MSGQVTPVKPRLPVLVGALFLLCFLELVKVLHTKQAAGRRSAVGLEAPGLRRPEPRRFAQAEALVLRLRLGRSPLSSPLAARALPHRNAKLSVTGQGAANADFSRDVDSP